MKVDYKKLHSELKQKILRYLRKKFKYIETYQFNDENYRQSRIHDGFTITILGKEDHEESSSAADSLLVVQVKFDLDAKNDKYLDDLGHTEFAIDLLKDVDLTEANIKYISPYFSTEFIGERVVVTYDNVYILIRNKDKS